MASGILGIALSGLNAAQAGIRTTQHNIANVNTAGFRRQEVNYAALQPDYSAAGYFGTGVGVETVRSLYSRFLDTEVLMNQSQLARHQTYSAQASQIDKLLGDAGSGLSTALDAFFAAVNEVANDPTANAARQVMLSAGASLAYRVNTLDDKLRAQLNASNGEIVAVADRISVLSSQIARVNGDIARAEALNAQPANDLRDQRDQLIGELGKLVDVTRLEQGDGSVSVFFGSGQPLVMGTQFNTLGTTLDADGLRQLELNMGGNPVSVGSGLISGGQLGGLLQVREQVILPAFSDLNRIAVVIGAEVNRVHRLGEDINQVAGGDFFTGVVNQTAGAAAGLGLAFTSNALPNENYTVVFSGPGYDVTRVSDGATVNVAAGVEVVLGGVAQGFSVNAGIPAPLAGAAWDLDFKDYARGMSSLLTNTGQIAAAAAGAGGPGDNTNALALASLQTAQLFNDGSASFSGAYNQIVTRTASLAAQADLSRSAYTSLVDASKASQQAVSGVNLDEEAVNLIRFQQAYQASARAIQIAASLFDEVLGIVR